ncbi:MAG TPA: hypothetical protein VK177_11825 [Flavobacteriales bacterium]|nr:hypothetical protein [Flavobacteriales bacterium]
MQKTNNSRIEETLTSLNGIKRAEANAYTFDKVMLRLEEQPVPAFALKWNWIIGMLTLIIMNASVAVYSTQTSTSTSEHYYEDLVSEIGDNIEYSY